MCSEHKYFWQGFRFLIHMQGVMAMCVCMCMCAQIYKHMYVCVCVCVYNLFKQCINIVGEEKGV